MSVVVTLHIYSGNPDPTWELTDAQAQELAARLAAVQGRTLQKPAGIIGGLGYRGFSIQSVRETNFEPLIYIHGGIIDTERLDINKLGDASVEDWLLSTSGSAINGDLREYVAGEIHAGNSATATNLIPGILAVPPFDPGKWNNDPSIQRNNNCYNYANDKITNTFAQPGRGSGTSGPFPPDCGGTGAASQRDGQVPVANAASTPAQGHFIALVIWPGRDYHWYRLDSNAMWSHKPGQTPAKNTDESGAQIADPRTCNRGPYTTFCGFYHCIPANTRIA